MCSTKQKQKNQSTQKNDAAHVDLPEKLPRAVMDLRDGVEAICWILAFWGPPAPPAGESDNAIMKPVIVSPFSVAFEWFGSMQLYSPDFVKETTHKKKSYQDFKHTFQVKCIWFLIIDLQMKFSKE